MRTKWFQSIAGVFALLGIHFLVGCVASNEEIPSSPSPLKDRLRVVANGDIHINQSKDWNGLRVVAIGDIHGDLQAAEEALWLAGVMDGQGRWIGDDTVVVQVGDLLDRGDDERAILDLFERLTVEAAAVGGQVISLLGNHEIITIAGVYDFATPQSCSAFS